MVNFLRVRQVFPGILGLVLLLGLSFSGIGVLQLSAAPLTDVIISEYIEGSSNNKAIEIYNGTGAAINLSTGSYVLQMYFNGSATAGLTISLTGTVADGDVYVVAHGSANATILAQADQTNSSGWFNGDDAVVLRKGGAAGTVVDSIGQLGTDPGTEWGSGVQSTADNTIRRMAGICVGDTNTGDAYNPSTEWDGFAVDTFGDLGTYSDTCSGDNPPTVSSTSPVDNATGVSISPTITITFNENVTAAAGWFTIVCDAVDVSADFTESGGPSSYTLTYGGAGFTGGENCVVTLNNANITDSAAQNLDGNGDTTPGDDYSFDFTLSTPLSLTMIHDVQGNGSVSPLDGTSVMVRGIVVGDYQAANELEGFYVQEEDADVDADPNTSEGIFVFCGAGGTCPAVAVGDQVTVTGAVDEAFSQTQIDNDNSNLVVVVNSSGNTLPVVTTLNVGTDLVSPAGDKDSFYEPFEGMLVSISDTLSISEYFEHFRFGEIVLYQGGRPYQYTHNDNTPTAAEYTAFLTDLSRRRIILDDGSDVQNRPLSIVPQQLFYPYPGGLSTGTQGTDFFRGGDTISGLTGVLGYAFSEWRLQPSQASYTFTPVNTRPSAPVLGGNIHIASFNVLNYFTTIDTLATEASGPCGPSANQDCRGADSAAEFTLQNDKLMQALAEIDADVFGLIEIENSGTTIATLVSNLNAVVGAGTYDYINTGFVGTDAITVAIIYKPAVVQPSGSYLVDTDAIHNRPPLAQTFTVVDPTNTDYGGSFTVIINHFKSKGSACGAGDDDTTTGQGNCNGTRVQQATRLLTWINGTVIPSTGEDDVLIIGDLNSNRGEDPITTLLAGGYTNLVDTFIGINAYSYVFDGQLGYLDHALGNSTMTAQVVGVADWHINADEPVEFDYNDAVRDTGEADSFEEEPDGNPLYEANPYRTSDHDPVIIAIDLDVDPPLAVQVQIAGSVTGVIRSNNVQRIRVLFDKALRDAGIADPDSVTNPDNYILFHSGLNGVLDTPPIAANFCALGANPVGDDIKITFSGVVYDTASYETTLNIETAYSPLAQGEYLLVVCGSTSIVDTSLIPLDGNGDGIGGDDFSTTFTIIRVGTGTGTGSASGGTGGGTGTIVDGGIDYNGDGLPDVTQLPNTGESPVWNSWIVWAGALLLLATIALLIFGGKKQKN